MRHTTPAEQLIEDRAATIIKNLDKEEQAELNAYIRSCIDRYREIPDRDVIIKGYFIKAGLVCLTFLLLPAVFGTARGCAEHAEHHSDMANIRREEMTRRNEVYEREITQLKSTIDSLNTENLKFSSLSNVLQEFCKTAHTKIDSVHETQDVVDPKVDP